MPVSVKAQLSQFALDVADGLRPTRKKLPPRYFYDDLGAALFEAITLLPEYGLTRADERLILSHARDIVRELGEACVVAELGSGTGKKTRRILEAFSKRYGPPVYRPIDVSSAALTACDRELCDLADVQPICGDWMDGLSAAVRSRSSADSLLLLFLGSSIGNLDREAVPAFLAGLRSHLQPGDCFLLGADLVKDVGAMIRAYDDATGVTAAFNRNLLGRMNRELGANFELRAFAHEARWNSEARRIEMHLRSEWDQAVFIGALETVFEFRAGETIWTESSHKFTEAELDSYAQSASFSRIYMWVDREWPFAETLWRAV